MRILKYPIQNKITCPSTRHQLLPLTKCLSLATLMWYLVLLPRKFYTTTSFLLNVTFQDRLLCRHYILAASNRIQCSISFHNGKRLTDITKVLCAIENTCKSLDGVFCKNIDDLSSASLVTFPMTQGKDKLLRLLVFPMRSPSGNSAIVQKMNIPAIKLKICGLQLAREPRRSTRLLQLTGRWQHDGIMWLALRSVKSNNVDFLNQIRYFSIK